MDHRWGSSIVALLVLMSCSGSTNPRPTPPPSVRGGTFRAEIEDFGFSDDFNPTGEASPLGMALHSQLLLRTLVTYRHVAGQAGTEPVPDLATDTGEVSPDGLTWTFQLKEGVRFAPPVSRPITSADVEYAFRRVASEDLATEYGLGYLYDGLIEGMEADGGGVPVDISGIETPNPRTIVFRLTRPAGDFPHRMAMPAAAPIPQEVAGCFGKPGDYGRDVVATGPYMIEGADRVNISSCSRIRPMVGFDRTNFLHFVRNPDYDPKTDDPAIRESFPDRIEIDINTNTDDILHRVDKGLIDGTLGPYGLPVMAVDQLKRAMVHSGLANGPAYVSMNVLVPPFDDAHVRRAVNLVLNRQKMLVAMGGPKMGPAAVTLFPAQLVGDRDPKLPISLAGNASAAAREMSRSRYDQDADGVCDAEACANVLFLPPTTPPYVNIVPILKEALASLGIQLDIRELTFSVGGAIHAVQNLIPLALIYGPRMPYPDPSATARSLHSAGIDCEDQVNFAEVGITEDEARTCHVLEEYRAVTDHLPSLDSRIEHCQSFLASASASCWAEFDAYVMREVVPWAPIRFPRTFFALRRGLDVFEFDQAFGTLSLSHVAVRS